MRLTDIQLQAFFGAATPLENLCMVYPLKIKEIIGMGELEYRSQLNLLTSTSADLYEYYKNRGIAVAQDIDVFENILESCDYDVSFLLDVQKAFSTFIREQVQILPDLQSIVIGNGLDKRIIDKDKFYTFQKILRIQNRLPIPEEIPKDETPMQRKFRLKREALQQAKKKQAQKDTENAISFFDSISSLCVCGIGVNFENVGELSIFAFHELLDRYEAKTKYENDLDLILAGVDPKKIKLKYWIRNLNDDN